MIAAQRGTLWRRALRSTTALQAVAAVALAAATLAPTPAAALPPNAQPGGGQVVAGSASISQTPSTTTVTQSSNRAAVNWQSFDVGSQQTVQFQQPSASAATLNRVVGPNPSEIAGRIQANGQIIVQNQAGVVFDKGSQVNAAGLVVTAAGISNGNFMAGNMVFDQAANPNAKVVNRGTITVQQAGLAALVAPSVRNAGVIRARMGTVIMAGAETDTLDLYGDGLVSIDVTKQVSRAPDGKRALVTNSGTIEAQGGSVVLTAAAVDGVVDTLVDAGGRIDANSAGGRNGQVLISGAGGDVRVEGVVTADGNKPGATGGAIAVSGSRATIVGAHARISASGQAGGGTIALGTTLARAAPGGGVGAGGATTARLLVRKGAAISADAKQSGNGGRVVALASNDTKVAGSISARGAGTAGQGGSAELSSGDSFLFIGDVDLGAPSGRVGALLIDPATLDVIHGSTTTTPDTITDGQVNTMGMTADVTLQATSLLTVNGTSAMGGAAIISIPNHALTLEVGLLGALDIQPGSQMTATTVTLGGGAATIAGSVTGTTSVVLNTLGNVTETELSQPGPTGSIVTPLLTGNSAGVVTLTGNNQVTSLGQFSAAHGFTLNNDTAGLTVSGSVDGGPTTSISNTGSLAVDATVVATGSGTVNLVGNGITQSPAGVIIANTLTGSAGTGAAQLNQATNIVPNLGAFTAANGISFADTTPTLTVTGAVNGGTGVSLVNAGVTAGNLLIANTLSASGTVNLQAIGISQTQAGVVTAGTLTGSSGSGSADFSAATNAVTALGPFTAGAGFALNNNTPALIVVGAVDGGPTVAIGNQGSIAINSTINAADSVTLYANGISQTAPGVIITNTLAGGGGNGAADFGAAANVIPNLGAFTAADGFTLNDVTPTLTVVGAVNGGTGVALTNTGALLIADTVAGSDTVSLNAQGIAQTAAGAVTGGTLTGSANSGAADFSTAANDVTGLGPFTAASGFSLNDYAPSLTVVGAVNGGSGVLVNNTGDLTVDSGVTASGPVNLTAGGDMVQNAAVQSTGASVTETAADNLSQSGGTTAATDATLTATNGALTLTGGVTAAGTASLTAGGDLFQDGAVQSTAANVIETAGGDLSQSGATTAATTAALTATNGALTLTGGLTAAGTASLTAGGDLFQDGTVRSTGANVTETAAGDLSQSGITTAATTAMLGARNVTLTQGAGVTAGSNATLLASADLTQDGTVTATGGNASLTAAGNLTEYGNVNAGADAALTATSGTLMQAGSVTAGDSATLAATQGTLDQTGKVTAGNGVTFSAGGDLNQGGTATATGGGASLTAANNLTQSGTVTAADAVTLTAGNNLTQSGTVGAGTDATLTATNGSLSQSGSVGAGGDATLTAGDGLTQTGSVTAGSDAVLTAQTGDLLQSNRVTAGTSAILLASLGNLADGGTITAPNIQLAAPNGTVNFTGSFAGVVRDPTLNPNRRLPQGGFPSNRDIGAWISAANINIAPSALVFGAGGPAELVTLLTNPGGTVTLSNFNNQQTQLYLELGTGFAQGQIAVNALQVQYTLPGTRKTINLIGTVDGYSGTTAATASFIQPRENANYQVNGCPIQGANCFQIPTFVFPIINPLKDLEVESPPQADDILIILPDVGERDY